MSSTFRIRCEDCEEDGPRIHRRAGGSGLWPSPGKDIFNEGEISLEWCAWLIAHEFCDMKLTRYG